jgi:hypothetical protein
MTGIAFSLSKQAISQGTLTTQLTVPEGASLAVVRLTVATADPSAIVSIGIGYTDYSGVNPPPASQSLALAEATNELNFIVPVTPTNGAITLSFPVTGTAGAYNALVLFK